LLAPREEKALNLALNKHSGEWDFAALADLLTELHTGDFDMEVAGFSEKELKELMEQAAWRFIEFFTATIRNKNTRAPHMLRPFVNFFLGALNMVFRSLNKSGLS